MTTVWRMGPVPLLRRPALAVREQGPRLVTEKMLPETSEQVKEPT